MLKGRVVKRKVDIQKVKWSGGLTTVQRPQHTQMFVLLLFSTLHTSSFPTRRSSSSLQNTRDRASKHPADAKECEGLSFFFLL